MRVTVTLELDVPDYAARDQVEAIIYDAMAGTDEPSNPDIISINF